MSGNHRTSLAAAFGAAAILSACLPTPVEVGGVEGAEVKEAVKDDPVVWIADPADNARVRRETFFGASGIEVRFAGEFVPGHTLHLSASPQYQAANTFYVTRMPVTGAESPGPSRVRGDHALLNGADRVILRLRVNDHDDVLISLDSVRIRLR